MESAIIFVMPGTVIVGEGFAPIAMILGLIVFALVVAGLYAWLRRTSARTAETSEAAAAGEASAVR